MFLNPSAPHKSTVFLWSQHLSAPRDPHIFLWFKHHRDSSVFFVIPGPQCFHRLLFVFLWLWHPCTPRDSFLSTRALCPIVACLGETNGCNLEVVLQQSPSPLARRSGKKQVTPYTLHSVPISHLGQMHKYLMSCSSQVLGVFCLHSIIFHPASPLPLSSLHVIAVFCHSMTLDYSVSLAILREPILLSF